MNRRSLLSAIGTGVVAGLAGCADGADETETDEDVETIPGEEYPAVDEWLSGVENADEEPTYDGTIEDRRGQDEVTVRVGQDQAEEEYVFDPPAVAVAPGTTVRWAWAEEGGAHNVVADPEHQIGETDYEFSSGEPTAEGGATFERTLADPGIALYHCESHLPQGMKGAIVVAEA